MSPIHLNRSPEDHQILALLRESVARGASDLHFQGPPDSRFWLRIDGELVDGGASGALGALDQWVSGILTPSSDRSLGGDVDFSFAIEGLARFRVHLYRMSRTWGAVLRVISAQPPTLQSLGVPEILNRIPKLHRGLVLVTGATGSGKSSTLAALIHEINRTEARHIVTIEDPIEFIHPPIKSRLSQREVGTDTLGFADSLRSALREDPDVILVGEMRDPETVAVALKAAETGHLVLSTVHTQDAERTIGRVIALFPPEEQRLVRLRLADNLAAIVSQRLVEKKTGGRAAAMEIVMATQSVRDCIEAPERTAEMLDLVQTSGDGQSFDRHLVELYLSGQISLDTARNSATRPADLERELRFGKHAGAKLSEADRLALEQEVELSGDGAGRAEPSVPSPKEKGPVKNHPFDSLKIQDKASSQGKPRRT